MFCIRCGVKLADTESRCPLCGTRVFHPDLERSAALPLYPDDRYPETKTTPIGLLIVISTLFLIAALIAVLCDLRLQHAVTWSGYVVGALVLGYVAVILPMWFKKPNPVIFVPSVFICVGGFLALVL